MKGRAVWAVVLSGIIAVLANAETCWPSLKGENTSIKEPEICKLRFFENIKVFYSSVQIDSLNASRNISHFTGRQFSKPKTPIAASIGPEACHRMRVNVVAVSRDLGLANYTRPQVIQERDGGMTAPAADKP